MGKISGPMIGPILRRAFAANIFPAILLWSFALALLLGYRQFTGVRETLENVAELRARYGLWFTMSAQAAAAALLPFLFQKLQSGDHRKTRLVHLPYLMLALSTFGATNLWFYDWQAKIFGSGSDFFTLAQKTALDMLVYTPFYAMPLVTLIFAFKDADFSISKTRELLGKGWLFTKTLPIYLGALLVWVPTLFVLYSLPTPLQFPFQIVVQCFWGLVLVVLTDRPPSELEGQILLEK